MAANDPEDSFGGHAAVSFAGMDHMEILGRISRMPTDSPVDPPQEGHEIAHDTRGMSSSLTADHLEKLWRKFSDTSADQMGEISRITNAVAKCGEAQQELKQELKLEFATSNEQLHRLWVTEFEAFKEEISQKLQEQALAAGRLGGSGSGPKTTPDDQESSRASTSKTASTAPAGDHISSGSTSCASSVSPVSRSDSKSSPVDAPAAPPPPQSKLSTSTSTSKTIKQAPIDPLGHDLLPFLRGPRTCFLVVCFAYLVGLLLLAYTNEMNHREIHKATETVEGKLILETQRADRGRAALLNATTNAITGLRHDFGNETTLLRQDFRNMTQKIDKMEKNKIDKIDKMEEKIDKMEKQLDWIIERIKLRP